MAVMCIYSTPRGHAVVIDVDSCDKFQRKGVYLISQT